MEWSYAITAVPQRADNLLVQTVQELEKGGFADPVIIMDGPMPEGPSVLSRYTIIDHPHLGHIKNWLMALHYVFYSKPQAQYFAIFEDDLLCVPNLRQYLETCEYPDKGYWNLITHDPSYIKIGPQHGWHVSNQRGWGAVGLVFSRQAVIDLLQCSKFVERATAPKLNAADGLVLYLMKRQGYREWIHSPSLLQHTGVKSTLKNHVYGPMVGFRRDYNPLEDVA